jgi:hypothetical protein
VACWQGAHASDPTLRAVMARIARDETSHAALAFAVARWLDSRVPRVARARVRETRERALASLCERVEEAPSMLRVPLGLPKVHELRGLAAQLARLAA